MIKSLKEQEVVLKAIETYYSDYFDVLTTDERLIITEIINRIIDNIKEVNEIWNNL